jgi:hypothetical protein
VRIGLESYSTGLHGLQRVLLSGKVRRCIKSERQPNATTNTTTLQGVHEIEHSLDLSSCFFYQPCIFSSVSIDFDTKPKRNPRTPTARSNFPSCPPLLVDLLHYNLSYTLPACLSLNDTLLLLLEADELLRQHSLEGETRLVFESQLDSV